MDNRHDRIEITVTRYNLWTVMCWIGVVLGSIGLLVRVAYDAEQLLWLSIIALIASGVGITFGPQLKSVEKECLNLKKRDSD